MFSVLPCHTMDCGSSEIPRECPTHEIRGLSLYLKIRSGSNILNPYEVTTNKSGWCRSEAVVLFTAMCFENCCRFRVVPTRYFAKAQLQLICPIYVVLL